MGSTPSNLEPKAPPIGVEMIRTFSGGTCSAMATCLRWLSGSWVPHQIVNLPSRYEATPPPGSKQACSWQGVRTVLSITNAAAERALSTLPFS